ncbi:hypothetical protein H8S25_09635 [Roseburia sp. NSJ-67]|uniref:Uncharacterized protein n=1 Tax=Roseburia difficilis TaxID=2763060 RepID=A0ABR7GWB6_9FIRM|nr:hypothetical protein [Roseburia difficilis]
MIEIVRKGTKQTPESGISPAFLPFSADLFFLFVRKLKNIHTNKTIIEENN